MARIQLPDITTITDEQNAAYSRFPTNLTRALLCTDGCAGSYLDLGFSLRATRLTPKEYELIVLRVAALSGSAYERMQHLPAARQAGWSDVEINAIENHPSDTLSEAAQALISFIDDCVRNVRVEQNTFDLARRYYSDGTLADATLLTGFYMMTARFLETLKVDLDATPCNLLLAR